MDETIEEFETGDIIAKIGEPEKWVVFSSGFDLYYLRILDVNTGQPGPYLDHVRKGYCHQNCVKLEHLDPKEMEEMDWSAKNA